MEQMTMMKMNDEIIALKDEVARMRTLLEDDLEFARRTEEAWQEIDEGKFTKHNSAEEFFESLKNDN